MESMSEGAQSSSQEETEESEVSKTSVKKSAESVLPEITEADAEELGVTGPPAKHKSHLWWWIFGVVVVLGVFAVLVWQFKWYQPVYDRYQAGSVSIKVEEDGKFPIQDATLILNGSTYTSNADGRVDISSIVAGTYTLSLKKVGYQDVAATLTLHRGVNDIQTVAITRTPDKLYAIKGFAQDYVSGLPITNVTVTLGNTILKTDAAGAYTFDKQLNGDYTISLSKSGYINKQLTVTVKDADSVAAQVPLVPVGTVIFTSNQSGKRGLYSINYDGSGRQAVVPSNGEEYSQMLSPDGKMIAFLSTRDSVRNSYGTVVPLLYVSGTDGKNIKKVSDDIISGTVIVWSPSSRYIYFEGYSDPQLTKSTNRIFDVSTGVTQDLGTNDQWEAFSPDGGTAIYVTNTTVNTISQFTISTLTMANGQRTDLVNQGTGYASNIVYALDGKSITYDTVSGGSHVRYKLDLASTTPQVIDAVRADSRVYVVSPDKKLKAFVDTRDGKTDVYMVKLDGTAEQRLTTVGVAAPAGPITWDVTSTYITFGLKREGEQALYVVSTKGGEPKKVVDYYDNSANSQ